MQIYNERIYDLQQDGNTGPASQAPGDSLALRESAERGVFVEGLTEVEVSSAAEAQAFVARGNRNRRTAATHMNRESSRSHSVFTLEVRRYKVFRRQPLLQFLECRSKRSRRPAP